MYKKNQKVVGRAKKMNFMYYNWKFCMYYNENSRITLKIRVKKFSRYHSCVQHVQKPPSTNFQPNPLIKLKVSNFQCIKTKTTLKIRVRKFFGPRHRIQDMKKPPSTNFQPNPLTKLKVLDFDLFDYGSVPFKKLNDPL